MKTIAFYNWEYPGGGAETVTRNLGCFFHSQGFRVVIFTGTLHEERLTEEERRDFTPTALPRRGPEGRQIDYEAFGRSLAAQHVDWLIVQSIVHADFESIRRESGCKIIFCLHNIPLWEVCEIRNKSCSDLPRQSLAARLEYVLLRKPVNRLTDKLKRRYLKSYAAMMPHIDRMVMLCPEYREEMERLIRRSGYPGCDARSEKYASIFNPLLPPATVAGPETRKEKCVLYAGRFTRQQKRVDRLLKIWQRIERRNPEWRLVLVGDGSDRANLEKLARRLELQRVEFTGHKHDVTPYYRRAAFVCLTSNYEGLPMCLTEGQQHGAIPVSFDSYAGIREIAREGESGIVVPAFNLREYARRLDAAMNDQDLQQRMRKESYRAAERYDLQRIGAEWLRLFDEL